MQTLYIILFVSFLAVIVGAVYSAAAKVSLQKKFVGLGNMAGLTKAEIIAVVGQPNSVTTIGPDMTLLQWQRDGYHIALIFQGEVCSGISHEHAI